MNRTFLMILLALALIVMGMSSYLIWDSIQNRSTLKSFAQVVQSPLNQSTAQNQPPLVQTQTSQSPQENAQQASQISKETKKPIIKTEESAETTSILSKKVVFQYRDAVAKRVAVIGNFNQWNPQMMRKNQKHLWTITLAFAPGEYVYNFIIDDKIIRDPANRKTKNAGQKIPSSLLIVKPK